MSNSRNSNSIEGTPAVMATDVVYRHEGQKEKVLDGLSMTVFKSSIYGLTGSSGCGKTTLMSCILGIRSIQSGEISLFGCNQSDTSNKAGRYTRGRDVGYMPQEISLYQKFTVMEILAFFGHLYQMCTNELDQAIDKLLELTQLHDKRNARIESLSGGQQRRVSFMISLVHSPRLILLDEPTVGMDPLLRARIWNHLRYLVKFDGVTVIITTHYVDEMRKADRIGILGNGKIKAENSPNYLLSISNSTSLNDAVLKIRKNPSLFRIANESTSALRKNVAVQRWLFNSPENNKPKTKMTCTSLFKPSVVRVLTRKSWTLLLRNVPFLLFLTLSPAIQLLSTLIPSNPLTHVRLGVVNNELLHRMDSHFINSTNAPPICPDITLSNNTHCEKALLSCVFINMISNNEISLSYFSTKEDAITAVHQGKTRGYISFSEIFSKSLVSRALTYNSPGTAMNMTTLIGSHITAQLDQSNSIARYFILLELHRVQKEFLALLHTLCGNNKESGRLPLQYKTPIFGEDGGINLSEYAGLGLSPICIFFYGLISSGLNFQEERNSGMLSRLLMSGVKYSEVVIAHYVAETIIILVQASLLFVLIYRWIPLHEVAPFPLVFLFLLNILSGYLGMSVGFLLGTLLHKQVELAMIGLAAVLPNLFLSGTVWPLESMPELMQMMVKLLPSTLGTESLRWAWSRGFGITHPHVWPAIVSFFICIIIINITSMVIHKCIKT